MYILMLIIACDFMLLCFLVIFYKNKFQKMQQNLNEIKHYLNDFCNNFNTLRDEFIALHFMHDQLKKSIENKLQKNNKKIKKPLDNKN